ncbi:MAG: DNA topoisomerase IV subunit A [Streptococcaceae bacterium]|jgi:topoisomerase-4 subunit A|nr:DNA topoisomerase IV subunit A [Streptococcaceae bacterium]
MATSENIQELTLEEVMGERFGRYSKYIIQDRAIPDIRDGLKPVQRRILYSMNKDGNTFDKAYRKSAKSVGNIMGNFHPHGDSSIYEAMVRMSQDWKLRGVLIDMHGNNGSMDGDSPAAMRYTEARLSKLAGEILQDIEKETVDYVWNFDDTEKEPTVLPTRYPNLLVNGSTGISAGYATEIPPHTLGEVIDGTVFLIDHPEATLEEIMNYIPAPDFPTGGILQGVEEAKEAYRTGRGKVIVRSKTEFESIRGGREQIVVTEIPYEVNKANLVKKIHEIGLMKKIDGISDVRDESDRTGLRIVVELKKDANSEGILNYLLKNTDLQINYNFNMVAIDNRTPKQVGLKQMIQSYIHHRVDVITRRSEFELKKAENRAHIVEGLIKALSILDKVIRTIRSSKDKKDAKKNLIANYGFTEIQAEAIVVLQLYRLTNTDVTLLEKEAGALEETIQTLKDILNDKKVLFQVMKKELKEVKKTFNTPRLTRIEKEIQEIKIETQVLIASEDVMVVVTKEGYIKRTSIRSFQASPFHEIGLKEGDDVLFAKKMNTLNHLLLFTNKGNVIYRPVHELNDIRWKDLGEHITQTLTGFQTEERIIGVIPYIELREDFTLVAFTKQGYIKQVQMSDFAIWRTYKSKSTSYMKLKTDSDEVLKVFLQNVNEEIDVFLVTNLSYALRYSLQEVPVSGKTAAGVKSINLKPEDFVVGGDLIYEGADEEITLLTHRGALKRMIAQEIEPLGRAKRGLLILRTLKNNPHRVIFMEASSDAPLLVITNKGNKLEIKELDYPISTRESNGSFVLDEKEEAGIFHASQAYVFVDEENEPPSES